MADFFPPRFNGPGAPPPPAPPLPPQRYAQRATNALVRFAQPFIGGSRPPSAHGHRVDELSGRAAPTSIPRSSSPASSQTTWHRTGIAIAALDISPERTHAVLAGREILKTVRVSGANCTEEFNLRAALVAYASTHNSSNNAVSAKHKDQLAAVDVKWSHGQFASFIATAVANGKIVIYDINRAGVEMGRIHEHQRQVHSLDFNPNGGHLLLSGSQDSSIRLWDMRMNHKEQTGISWFSTKRFPGNSEGVRHVKWSPSDVFHFACATDSGTIQKWDIRKDTGPLLRITAHSKMCTAIDFHPDGKHLVSGSADKTVKVWDFLSTEKRQKPTWSFGAPQGVTKVCWRPPSWSSRTKPSGSWETTQLVTAYNQQDPRVHIWDFRRPNVPFREIDKYATAPTSLLWHSEDFLWTAGLEGIFTQTDVHFAPKLFDRRPLQAFDSSPKGDFTFLAQRRPRRRGSGLDAHAGMLSISGSTRNRESGEKLSSSKSATDDSADDSYETGFFGSSFRKGQKRPSNAKSPSKSQANTPPSASNGLATHLDETLILKSVFRPDQRGSSNISLASLEPDEYAFLAVNYRQSLLNKTHSDIGGVSKIPLDQYAANCFRVNALLATQLQLYRLAQTWRILGELLVLELEARAQTRRKGRLQKAKEVDNPLKKDSLSHDNDDQKILAQYEGTSKSNVGRKNKVAANGQDNSESSLPIGQPKSSDGRALRGPGDLTKQKPPSYSSLPASPQSMKTPSNAGGTDHTESPVEFNKHSKTSILPVTIDRRGAGQTRNTTHRMMSESLASPSRQFKGQPSTHRSTPSDGYSGLGSAHSRSFDMNADSFDSEEMRIGRMSFEDDVVRPQLYQADSFESDITQGRSSVEYEDRLSYEYDGSLQQSFQSEQPNTVGSNESITRHADLPAQQPTPTSTSPKRSVFPSVVPRTLESKKNSDSNEFIYSDFLPTDPHEFSRSPVSLPHLSLRSLIAALLPYLLGPVPTDTLAACTIVTLLLPLFPNILPPTISLQIVQMQHDALVGRELFVCAASLRKLLLPLGATFQSVWYTYTADIALKFSCLVCGRPLKKNHHKCNKCKARVLDCMICGDSRHEKGRKLREWCQSCSHGGHVDCVEAWFKDEERSLGGCAVMGCVCDCRPGKRREAKVRKLSEEKEKKKKESQRKYASPRLLRDDILSERRGSFPLIKDLKSERGGFSRRSMGAAMDPRLRKEMNSKTVARDAWDVEESRAVNRATGELRLGLSGRSVSPVKGQTFG